MPKNDIVVDLKIVILRLNLFNKKQLNIILRMWIKMPRQVIMDPRGKIRLLINYRPTDYRPCIQNTMIHFYWNELGIVLMFQQLHISNVFGTHISEALWLIRIEFYLWRQMQRNKYSLRQKMSIVIVLCNSNTFGRSKMRVGIT